MTGRCLVSSSGAYLIVNEYGSPTVMHNQTNNAFLFEALQTGDKIKITHDEINLSYPGQTGVYSCKVLENGSIEDIPENALASLIEMNWVFVESSQSANNSGTAISRGSDDDTEPPTSKAVAEGFSLVFDGNTSIDNTLELTSEYQYFYIKVVNTGSSTISLSIGSDSSTQAANYYQIPSGTYHIWSTKEWPASSQAVSFSSSNGMSGNAYAYSCSTLTEAEEHS